MKTKVVKWGNSLGLRIPKAFADEVAITDGTAIELTVETGRLIIRPVPRPEMSLADLLAGVTPENLHGAVETGDAVGGEQW